MYSWKGTAEFRTKPARPKPVVNVFLSRVVGDLHEELGRLRSWGGLFNALALLLFMINTGRSIALGGIRGKSL